MDLLLLAPYDIHNPLPTLFEIFALDELGAALRNALSVGLLNLIDRAANGLHPAFLRLQPLLPEIELVLALLIEGRFLTAFDATTTQRLFGLKLTRAVAKSPVITRPPPAAASVQQRQQQPSPAPSIVAPTASAVAPATATATTTSAASTGTTTVVTTTTTTDPRLPQSVAHLSFQPLTRPQRFLMLLEAAFVPYLSRRLDAFHTEWNDTTPEGRERRDNYRRTAAAWRYSVLEFVAQVYPVVRALFGLSKLVAWLAYMSNRSPYPSVVAFLTQTVLTRRTPGDDAMQRMSAGSNRLMLLLSGAITWTIVGFEVADWWNRDGGRSSVLRDRRALPPPPAFDDSSSSDQQQQHAAAPPPDGICPVCRARVANPSVNIVSGYVCCYPCLSRHVREHGSCPAKPHLRTAPFHIRRLFVVE